MKKLVKTLKINTLLILSGNPEKLKLREKLVKTLKINKLLIPFIPSLLYVKDISYRKVGCIDSFLPSIAEKNNNKTARLLSFKKELLVKDGK